MELSTNDDVSLETTVMLALMRIQKERSEGKNQQRKTGGISCTNVVKYLEANCPWVDGDIESQVMTTLLSCVKAGLICALDSGKYRLIEPKSKNLVSSCETRVSHGPKCNCLKMLKNMVRSFRRPCCILKEGTLVLKRGRKTGRKSGKKSKICDWKSKCVLSEEEKFGASNSSLYLKGKLNRKCDYCLEYHSPPKSKNICSNCTCLESISGVPSDKFSPRDESSTERFSESWK